jgi:glutathione S-transferase
MAKIEIFGAPLSPFVSKVTAAADYKKLSYTLNDDVSPQTLPKLNPVTRKMPVAHFDGEMVYDSTFILRRFDEIQPTPALLSEDATIASRQRMLEDWSDESLYWHLMALRWAPENEDRTVAQMSGLLPGVARPFAKPIFRRLIASSTKAQGMGRLPYDVLTREIGERLDDLALLLGKQAFFHSDRPSVGDFAVYGEFNTGFTEATPDFAELVSQRPTLVDWHKRVEETTRH